MTNIKYTDLTSMPKLVAGWVLGAHNLIVRVQVSLLVLQIVIIQHHSMVQLYINSLTNITNGASYKLCLYFNLID